MVGDPLPRFVGRRRQRESAVFTVRADSGEGIGGLSLRIDELRHYDIEVGAGLARARVGGLSQIWGRPGS